MQKEKMDQNNDMCNMEIKRHKNSSPTQSQGITKHDLI